MTDPIVFGEADEASRAQMARCLSVAGEDAVGVLCADNHKGYSMPIGGVVASRDYVLPAGVGYDIACGNCAVRTDVPARDVDVARVMDEVWKAISFGVGRRNNERADHPVLDLIAERADDEQAALAPLAADQLGTVGSGNHYVDLFEDREDGLLWVGVHFGSRGFGHKTATRFLHLAAQAEGREYRDDMDAVPSAIRLGTPLADAYWHAMEIAGSYAYAGREWVVQRVLSVLGNPRDLARVHNHHNFAWLEELNGQRYAVVRKGATPARPGQRGFVGGSMGDDAVILEGVESEAGAASFYSTVHGAGRVMGRRQAAGRTRVTRKWVCRDVRRCDFKGAAGGFRPGPNGETPKCPQCGHKLRLEEVAQVVSQGAVDWDAVRARLRAQGVELRGGGADEAPECYKRLPDVLAAHAGTVRVLHMLRPIGVAMAGRDTYDPYKD